MIACIMDGPDVKPLWKKWLGTKLANVANYYYRTDRCAHTDCYWYKSYRQAQIDNEILNRQLQKMQDCFCDMYAKNAYPTIYLNNSDMQLIEEKIILDEWEVFRAIRDEEIERKYGDGYMLPHTSGIDLLVERTKNMCFKRIVDRLRDTKMVSYSVDKDSKAPAIIVSGCMLAGLIKS